MNNPKISVIMSVYDGEKYLDESIQSILNQTFKDFEFIIINDCSTDNSLYIIKQYAKNDKRIVLIQNEENIGLTKSLNKGLKIAKGKYIARMDADDVALSERFNKQYDYLEKNKNVFLLGTSAMMIDEDGNRSIKITAITQEKKIYSRLRKKNTIIHSSIMFRNDFELFYRENFKYAQDYDLYLRVLSEGKIIKNILEVLLYYRVCKNSISFSRMGTQIIYSMVANKYYLERSKYGKDSYYELNDDFVYKLQFKDPYRKSLQKANIKSSFAINEFKKTRRLCLEYIKDYGVFSKILLLYLLSYFGPKSKLLISIIPVNILRYFNE